MSTRFVRINQPALHRAAEPTRAGCRVGRHRPSVLYLAAVVVAAVVTQLPTLAGGEPRPVPVAASVSGDSVWSGTFTYTGTLDSTDPWFTGTVHVLETQTMTASVSVTLTDNGNNIHGYLSGPASGSGDYTRVFDHFEDDVGCSRSHYVSTEHIPPTSVDGELPAYEVSIADDGTFKLYARGGIPATGHGTMHVVVTGGCNPHDATDPYVNLIWVPELHVIDPFEGSVTGNGTTIDAQAHVTQDGWDATYTYHLTKACAPTAATRSTPGLQLTAAVCGGLVADAGGPYNAVRASTITLDGSKSHATSPATLTGYEWSWTPGADCPARTTLASSGAQGTQITITVLCGLNITLKVTDSDGHTATASTDVTVTARGGRFTTTPASSFQVDRTGGGVTDWTETSTAGQFSVGLNVPTCATVTERNNLDNRAVFCPYKPFGETHHKAGYMLATVEDHNGPFDGFDYVASTDLNVQSIGALNPNMRPGAPPPTGACRSKKPQLKTCMNFFTANTRLPGSQMTAYVDMVIEHEGFGAPGQPLTGHAGAMREATKTASGNVRARLEELVSRAPGISHETFASLVVDPAVENAETAVFEASKDPLPLLGTRKIYLFEPPTARQPGRWKLYACQVGDQSRCDRV
jgi:hypothetical protein